MSDPSILTLASLRELARPASNIEDFHRSQGPVSWPVEPPTAYRRRPPVCVNANAIEPDYLRELEAVWNAPEQAVPEITCYHLRDVVVDTDGVVFSRGGDVYEETTRDARLQPHPMREPSRTVHDPCLLLKKAGYSNYGHWLIELLPRIAVWRLLRQTRDLKVAIHDYSGLMESRVRECLDLAGVPAHSIVPVGDEPVLFSDLYVVSPISIHNHMKSPFAMRFLGELGRAITPGSRKRLFISRKISARRRLLNEDEVFAALVPYGFVRVFLERLSVREQMECFLGAELVAGPLGAGLANLVFSPPATGVLVIAPAKSLDFFFYDIACHRGQRYASVHGPSAGESPDELYHGDFQVAVEDVLAGLDVLLARRPMAAIP